MNDFPIIRLELERMKQSMMVALADYNLRLSTAVEVEMEKAITEFDFESEVGHATKDAISEVINAYFKYGEGRKIIKDAIESSLNRLFISDENV